MSLFKIFPAFLCFIFSSFVFTSELKNNESDIEKISSKIMTKYRQTNLVEINVQKTIHSEWKTKDQVSEGKIFYSKGKFRWENTIPEKSWVVYNGNILWNIQFSNPDFPGKNKVTKSIINKKNRDQILLMSLIDMKSLTEKFFIDKNKKLSSEDILVIDLEPIEKDQSVQNLKITMNIKTNQINEISFADDIGNKTTILFKDNKFLNKKIKNKFEYSPSKNDEVTQI